MTFAPLRTHRNEYIEKDFVFLDPETVPENERKPTPEAPDVSSTNAEEFSRAVNAPFRHISEVEARSATHAAGLGIPILMPDDLTDCPELLNAVKLHERLPIVRFSYGAYKMPTSKRLDDVPIDEWRRFRRKHFAESAEKPRFAFGSKIFTLFVQRDEVSEPVQVPHLRTGVKIAGVVFMVIALINVGGLYKRHHVGIAIGKPGAILMGDVVVLLVMLFFAYGVADLALHQFFETEAVGDAEFLHFMAIFGYVALAPFMSLYSSATSAQVVFIDVRGILSDSLAGKRLLKWDEIEDITLRDIYSVKQVSGGFYPKHVTQILEIIGPFRRIRLLEPPVKSTKTEILSRMTEYAPERLKGRLHELVEKW